MNYEESVCYIHSSNKFGMVLGLESISELLNRLGNPQRRLEFIHIAGTNGKGSTAAFIAKILQESGYCTGLYTSPFLEVFNERIRINFDNIPDDDLAEVTTKVKFVCDSMIDDGLPHPTEFEIVTAIAFCYFCMKNVDVVVLEVGLGGRYDATNVIEKSLVSVITSISMDHTQVLGDTIEKIAYEKAGIVKQGGVTFLYDQCENVKKVIGDICNEKENKLIVSDFSDVVVEKYNLNNQVFSFSDYLGNERKCYKIRLLGEHQIKNCILACNIAFFLMNNSRLVKISEENIRNGILNTKWAGRFEIISEKPLQIVDGAHNLDSAKMLSNEIDRLLDGYDKTLVIGVLEDKDVDGIVKALVPKFDRVVVTLPDSPRSMSVEDLSIRVGVYSEDIVCIEDPEEAIRFAIENVNKIKNSNKKGKFAIVSAGSLYLIGKIRMANKMAKKGV